MTRNSISINHTVLINPKEAVSSFVNWLYGKISIIWFSTCKTVSACDSVVLWSFVNFRTNSHRCGFGECTLYFCFVLLWHSMVSVDLLLGYFEVLVLKLLTTMHGGSFLVWIFSSFFFSRHWGCCNHGPLSGGSFFLFRGLTKLLLAVWALLLCVSSFMCVLVALKTYFKIMIYFNLLKIRIAVDFH